MGCTREDKEYVVCPPAQILHWIGVRSKMRMLGLGQPKFVPPLNNAMAIETGSNILGELTIFTIGISLILLEFTRQRTIRKNMIVIEHRGKGWKMR
ncbi:hypothetical protein ACLKA6_000897 [Drosophila palustris]